MRFAPIVPWILLGLASPAAGKAPAWGDFTREELFSTHFPEAPGADAVVLYDHAILKIDPKFRMKYRRHRRTKIFTEAGARRPEVRIAYREGERIRDFRAHTVIPPDRRIKVEGSQVSEERVGDLWVKVFTFPSVRPGVILEYTYELTTKRIDRIEPWTFQNDDFTRESRLDLQLPEGMSYEASFGWLPGTTPRPARRIVLDPVHPDRELHQSTWVMNNLPGYREEPLLRNPADYRATLFLQLDAFRSERKSFPIARTWAELGESVHSRYEEVLRDDQGLAAWAGRRLEGIDDPAGKARALYRLVRDGIREADPGSGEADIPSGLAEVVASGRASARGKNLLLLKLLRDEGIEAWPLLIRRRDRGTFLPGYHVLDQLDHLILRIDLPDGPVLVDAASGPCPFGILPPNDHVEVALLLEEDASRVVPVAVPAVKTRRDAETFARVEESGRLAGRSTWTLTGYEALAARRALLHEGEQSFVLQTALDRLGDVRVDSIRVRGQEEVALPLVVEFAFECPDYARTARRSLAWRMPLFFAPATNPVAEEERQYPMDFGYPSAARERVEVRLPEGFLVVSVPGKARAETEELFYSLASESDRATVETQRDFVVREVSARESRAPALRSFYEKVLASDGAEITARRQSARRPLGS